MGQIVMVVHADSTRFRLKFSRPSTIESCPVKLMVLEQGTIGVPRRAPYGYGYHYGYGHAATAKPETP